MSAVFAMWKFTRPHAFIGTAVSIVGLYVIALCQSEFVSWQLDVLATCLVACLSAAVYIVGLNQYYDVAIDRINKPYLPFASQEFSRQQVLAILWGTAALALIFAVQEGRYLLFTVVSAMMIGTAYSAPPLRLKRHHVWAALSILIVRSPIINLGLFLHFHYALHGSTDIPSIIWVLVALTLLFALVIAWSKDIPDAEGDAQYGVKTLVMRLGPQRLFSLGRLLLSTSFIAVMLAAAMGLLGTLDATTMIVSQGLLLGALWIRSRSVDPTDNAAIKPYYLFIWRLFQLEYIAFPLACALA